MKCLVPAIISAALLSTIPEVAAADAPDHVLTFRAGHTGPETPDAPISDDLLAGVRGMADVRAIDQIASVQNTATVEANTINGNVATGAIAISDTALNNVNGLALFNLNTGNNVSINSSMTVNVAIQQ